MVLSLTKKRKEIEGGKKKNLHICRSANFTFHGQKENCFTVGMLDLGCLIMTNNNNKYRNNNSNKTTARVVQIEFYFVICCCFFLFVFSIFFLFYCSQFSYVCDFLLILMGSTCETHLSNLPSLSLSPSLSLPLSAPCCVVTQEVFRVGKWKFFLLFASGLR